MQDHAERGKTVKTVIAVIVVSLLSSLFHTSVFQLRDWNEFASLYVVVGVANVAICFSIFTHGWVHVLIQMSRQRLITGILFLCALMPNLIHIMGAVGFPLFNWPLSMNSTIWMLLLSKSIIALGMLFTFRMQDRSIKAAHKGGMFIVGVLFTLAVMTLLLIGQSYLPKLMDEQGMTLFKKMMDIVILAVLLMTVAIMIYQGRNAQRASRYILIRGLIFFILGQVLYAQSSFIFDINHLMGLVSGCFGSYLILRGIYQHTIYDAHEEHRMTEAQISYLAYHDDLTGLPNLRKLSNRLEALIKKSYRLDGLTVVVLNFNRFKTINESLGRDAGDRILQMASRRIIDEVKDREEVYSMGGDEFAVILMNGGSPDLIVQRITSFINLFKEPLHFDTGDYHLSLSAGFAIYPEDGTGADHLVQNADTAVHDKKGHQSNIQRYTPSMQLKAQERLIMETELRRGLEREEFFLEYQPLVWLETDQVVGMEALVRWNHPERGIVYPGEFITIAEDSGLIVPLGEWVLRHACKQNKQWQKAGYKPICVSINISLGQFTQPNLSERIGSILNEIQLDPKYVELEITESMTLDKEAALDQLHRLKELGVRIGIDDFGTGYSSLHYLKNLPIDRLKIDRAFVNEILQDNNNAAIVSTIATMAHHLKLKVTAEGVETADQLSFLRNQQCHEGQGYYFSRPIGAWDFERAFLIH